MKSPINLKVMTITAKEWNENLDICKGYILLDAIHHGELVTVIYQTQSAITEINLNRMTNEKLVQLCKSENISTTRKKTANVPLTKDEILYFMDKEMRDAKWEGEAKLQEVNKKWQFVKYNIEALFENNKWRKIVFTEKGIPYFKTGYRAGAMKKSQLINALLEVSSQVYETYGFYIF